MKFLIILIVSLMSVIVFSDDENSERTPQAQDEPQDQIQSEMDQTLPQVMPEAEPQNYPPPED